MKSLLLALTILACSLGSDALMAQESDSSGSTEVAYDSIIDHSFELSEHDRRLLIDRIARIHEKDQQFRAYLSFGTMDDARIARLQEMDAESLMAAMAKNESELSDEAKSLLQQLQQKNDKENMDDFRAIVKQYGYPSKERLGVEADNLFILLLHPPVGIDEIESHMQSLCKLLLPEVKAGRLEARMYATFVDNMRGKILRLPQIYGTNQQFDRKSGKILPPLIEDLEKANQARREIGMAELKEGEFRIAPTKK